MCGAVVQICSSSDNDLNLDCWQWLMKPFDICYIFITAHYGFTYFKMVSRCLDSRIIYTVQGKNIPTRKDSRITLQEMELKHYYQKFLPPASKSFHPTKPSATTQPQPVI